MQDSDSSRQIISSRAQRFSIRLQRAYKFLHGRYWFPHVPLAIALILAGYWVLCATFGTHWSQYVHGLITGRYHFRLWHLPNLIIGAGMVIMGFGLLWRSRVAWLMSLLLAIAATLNTLIGRHNQDYLAIYFLLILAALLLTWRRFDRSSIAAGTLFALTSVAMLLMYATFGAFYLGNEFKPPIHGLITALYYAMVTMSTVGYGDIIPQTDEAKLFAVSIIVLGVAVFATSLTAVIGPLMSQSLRRIVNRKSTSMNRENHFVVVGNTPLAVNTWRELSKRGLGVTRILREAPEPGELKDTDVVIGDPSMTDVLREAGADKASAVLAMLADDSENAFVVLAVKELGGSARTVAAVNDARHLGRVKLVQPDVVIAPQVLGGELTAMLLAGEQVTPDFVMQRVFQNASAPAAEKS